MKRIITILILVAGVVSAAPPPKRSTVIYSPKKDKAVFKLLPTPATCELHVVTKHNLVWVKRERNSTTVIIQERFNKKPVTIVKFGGRRKGDVIGASKQGSMLFKDGEELIVSGDASARSSSDAEAFFLRDIRHTCPFEVRTVTSPSMFMQRLSEDKNPTFTIPIFRKGDKTIMRELSVIAIPGTTQFWKHIKTGLLPTPEQLRRLWPVVQWDKAGFTIWNGTEWKQFKWDANKAMEATQQNAP